MRTASWLVLLAGAIPALATLPSSPDGTCGAHSGYTCWLSFYGNCCGSDNKCGSTVAECGTGCKSDYGFCSGVQAPPLAKRAEAAVHQLQARATCNHDNLQRCIAPTGSASAAVASRSAATAYCSSYLSIPVVTSTVTSTPVVSTTATATDVISATDVHQKRAASTVNPPVCLTQGTTYVASRQSTACACLSVTPSTTFVTVTASTSTYVSTTTATCSTNPAPTASTLPNCTPCAGQDSTKEYCGLDINTNYYKEHPLTCNVVHYTFDIVNTTMSPDGYERIVLAVNNDFPGPVIQANWGDTVVVTINNKLQNNGTTIHWHGVRQLFTNLNDGVPSITQCPIAPGDSATYQWVAEQYGTSWYHSHFGLQAYTGLAGPIVINGPTTAPFDVDAGPILLTDWSHVPVDEMYDAAQTTGPQVMDNGLINGKNTFGADGSANQTGERFTLPTTFEPGKTYLLRIVNTAIQSTYKFYIDNHTLTVISTDFVPIVPYTTDILNINIGQRYNVLVTANSSPGDYWMRADNQDACAATTQALDIKGIIHYEGFSGTPTSTAYNYTGECVDEPDSSLVPHVALNASAETTEDDETIVVHQNSAGLFKWYLSGTTFQSEWGFPTLLGIAQNNTEPDFSGDLIINVPNAGEWVYIVVESPIPLPHPIHLHGHDFFVLAKGSGTYVAGNTTLNLTNPPRRDTSLLPAAGFMVIGFVTDNPGVWLMHCHIGWHASMGLALQVVEQQSALVSNNVLDDSCQLESTCAKFNTYAAANDIVTDDSGI